MGLTSQLYLASLLDMEVACQVMNTLKATQQNFSKCKEKDSKQLYSNHTDKNVLRIRF